MFNKARDAFIENVENVGLGMLHGHKMNPELGRKLRKYPLRNPDDETDIRTINASVERKRHLFGEVSRSMDSLKSQLVAESVQYTVARVRFEVSKASLNHESKKYLDQFAQSLAQDSQQDQTKLYVLGMASEEKILKNQWILSAKRAQEVAEYLRGVLPATGQYPVVSWGSGGGGNWIGESGFAAKDAHIFIAVLR